MRDHTKLRAFELADRLALAIYEATQAFPREEQFGLTSPMRRAAVSTASNIVEGCARNSERDYINFLQKMIAGGGVSFPEPDLSNIGGVTGWLKVAHLAEAHNLPVTTHGVHDLHVHLLAAVPNASYLEAHGFGLEAYIREPLTIEDGWAVASDRPGHGVSFDWEKMDPHRAA